MKDICKSYRKKKFLNYLRLSYTSVLVALSDVLCQEQLLLFMKLDKKHLESEKLSFTLKFLFICVILEKIISASISDF